VIYIRNGVDNEFITTHERVDGRCGLQGLMRHDELKDMGHFVPMRKKFYYNHKLKNTFHFLKISYFYLIILNLQSQGWIGNYMDQKLKNKNQAS
jgi:hypothetical protein